MRMGIYMYQNCIFKHIILILKFTNYILYAMPCISFRCTTTIHPVPTGYKRWPSGSSELCSCENSSTHVKHGLVEVSILRNVPNGLIHFKYLGSMKLQHVSHIFFQWPFKFTSHILQCLQNITECQKCLITFLLE
jgi:hypothetical protein